jgi:hypothetical protein
MAVDTSGAVPKEGSCQGRAGASGLLVEAAATLRGEQRERALILWREGEGSARSKAALAESI